MPVPFDEAEAALYAPEPVAPAVAPADLERPMLKHALASVRPELLAMDPARLVPVNVDIPTAITVVLGAARTLREHRAALVELVGEARASKVDRLELLARALGQANGHFRRDETGVDLPKIAAQASKVRAALHAELASLAARELIDLGEIELRGGAGYRQIAFDLVRMCTFFYDVWPAIESRTTYTMADVERAEGLANQLITGVSVREVAGPSPSGDLRHRAFSLLWEIYDEVRAMVHYLRWKEGDADRLAPSWHAGPKGRREEPTVDELVVPPAGEEVRPGLPGAPPFVDDDGSEGGHA